MNRNRAVEANTKRNLLHKWVPYVVKRMIIFGNLQWTAGYQGDLCDQRMISCDQSAQLLARIPPAKYP
jgi:hypothetical protein